MADGDQGEERGAALRRSRRERLEALLEIRQALSPGEQEELRDLWPEIYSTHFRRVWNVFSTRGLDRATAEDLKQDSFEEARLEIIEHGFPDDLGAYFGKIALGKLLNHLRRLRNCPYSVGLPSSGSEPPKSPPEVERDLDLQAFLQLLREKLSEDHLAIAELCIVNQLRIREAAEILDVPLGTATSRLRRAKEAIAELVKRWIPPSKRKGHG
jgi:RNA polymerase sigma factor (sigma-70 family)